jgi:hypothetical protein
MEVAKVEEHQLTPKQRKWLEASHRIGPGTMTRTERETLERLYADMLPAEQQELRQYIEEKYGAKDPGSQLEGILEDPVERMQQKIWNAPSRGLAKALSTAMHPKRRPHSDS